MLYSQSKSVISFVVVQLGDLRRAEASLAIGQANQVQRAFHFEFYTDLLPLDKQRYKLPNSGYDLDAATKPLLKNKKLPRPIILLTSVPYGDRDHGEEPEDFFFSDYAVDFDPQVMIISTYLWEKLPGERRLQPYILMALVTAVLSYCAGLEFHDESHGCLFDYCNDPKEIDQCFKVGRLCDSCERYLQAALRNGQLTMEQIAASKKIYNRALGQKVCFVVMPCDPKLKKVYNIIGQALREKGWYVIRGDEIPHPRRITDAVVQAILLSDLVVADLTGNNPNVFYEVGVAHASGCDVILLTQDPKIPFDITTERIISYNSDKRGLQALDNELRRFAGGGLW